MDTAEKRRLLKEELIKLREKEGSLTASSVLEAAKSPRSPLHDFFEWSDSEAARKYRLQQAGRLITFVYIPPKKGDDAERRPAFIRVVRKGCETEYVPRAQVFTRAEFRNIYAQQARASLDGWLTRFGDTPGLGNAVELVRQAMKAI